MTDVPTRREERFDADWLARNNMAQLPALIMEAIENFPGWLDHQRLVTARAHAYVLHYDADIAPKADAILATDGRDTVAWPKSVEEAELMEKLGFQYLAEYAPEKLTEFGKGRAATDGREIVKELVTASEAFTRLAAQNPAARDDYEPTWPGITVAQFRRLAAAHAKAKEWLEGKG